MMLEHNTPIEISNPTVRFYRVRYYRSVCRIVFRIPIGFLSDPRILGKMQNQMPFFRVLIELQPCQNKKEQADEL